MKWSYELKIGSTSGRRSQTKSGEDQIKTNSMIRKRYIQKPATRTPCGGGEIFIRGANKNGFDRGKKAGKTRVKHYENPRNQSNGEGGRVGRLKGGYLVVVNLVGEAHYRSLSPTRRMTKRLGFFGRLQNGGLNHTGN